jgi:hypothetical protein
MAAERKELDNKTWSRNPRYLSQVNPPFSLHLLCSSFKRWGNRGRCSCSCESSRRERQHDSLLNNTPTPRGK